MLIVLTVFEVKFASPFNHTYFELMQIQSSERLNGKAEDLAATPLGVTFLTRDFFIFSHIRFKRIRIRKEKLKLFIYLNPNPIEFTVF